MTANTPLSSPRRGVNLLHNHREVEAQRARSILKMEDEESENHLGSIFNNENESFDDDDDDDDAPMTMPLLPSPLASPPKETEQLVSNLAYPLHFSTHPSYPDIATAPLLLNANLGHSMLCLIDNRIKHHFTKLVWKSIIKNKGYINQFSSRILAHDIGIFDLSQQGSLGFIERSENPSSAGPVLLKGCVTSFNVPKDVTPNVTSRVIRCDGGYDEDDEQSTSSSLSTDEKHYTGSNSTMDKNTQRDNSKVMNDNDSKIQKNMKGEEGDADAAGGGSQSSVASSVFNRPAFVLSKNEGIDKANTNTTGIDKEESANSEGGENQHRKSTESTNSITPDSHNTDTFSEGRNKKTDKTVTEVIMPLTFAAIVDVEIGVAGRHGNKIRVSLEFGAPGSIMGIFKGSSSNCLLKSATVNIDTKSLFSSMTQQAKFAIRKLVTVVGPLSKEQSELGYLLVDEQTATASTAKKKPLLNRCTSTTDFVCSPATTQSTMGRMQQSSSVACSNPEHAEEMIRRASLASTGSSATLMGNSAGLGLPTTFSGMKDKIARINRRRRSTLSFSGATNCRRDSVTSTTSASSFSAAPAGSTRSLGEGSSCAKSEHAEEMIKRASMVSSLTVDGSVLSLGDHESNIAGGSCSKAAKAEEIIRRNSTLSCVIDKADYNDNAKEYGGSCPKARQAELLLRRASAVSSLCGDKGHEGDDDTMGDSVFDKAEHIGNRRTSAAGRSILQGRSLVGSKRRLSTTLSATDDGEKSPAFRSSSALHDSQLSNQRSTGPNAQAQFSNIPTKLWNLPVNSRRASESVVQSSMEMSRKNSNAGVALNDGVDDVGPVTEMSVCGAIQGDDCKSLVGARKWKRMSLGNTSSSGFPNDSRLIQHGAAAHTAGCDSVEVSEQAATSNPSVRRRIGDVLFQQGGPQIAGAATNGAASVSENTLFQGSTADLLGGGLLQQNAAAHMAEQVATIQMQQMAQLGMIGAMGGLVSTTAGMAAGPGLPQSNTAMLQQLQAAKVKAQVQQQVQAAQVAAAVRRNSYRRASFDKDVLGPLLAAFADEPEEGGLENGIGAGGGLCLNVPAPSVIDRRRRSSLQHMGI
mmetsp:Transcript_12130/g.16191  ORF Transcript_12130/g.16191 Transcript_12130/m.16191 type:complete len:1087 (+) Transcript_12130:39-3299(+)